MEQFPFLIIVFLVILGKMQGFSALTPVFVQTGEDVVLDVNGADCSEDGAIINWKFNQSDILVRLTCNNGKKPTVLKLEYKERTEIIEETSLKLKNCQKSFSGVYSAIRSLKKEEVVAEYNVTVEDPVSPVHLNVDSVFTTSTFCNLTVTCSTDHSIISSSFTCGNKSCKQDDEQQTEVTKQENLLQIYLSNESVICNHSNHVSWTNSTEKIELICLRNNKYVYQPGPETWVTILVIVAACFVASLVAFFVRKKKRCRAEAPKNHESAALQAPGPDDASSDPCKSIYSVVQPHQQTTAPRTGANNLPESVYAQVEKPGRSKNPPTPKAPGDQPSGPEDAPSDPSKSIYSVVQLHQQTTAP
ncbi:hypothetical protein OJAV_G00168170 [Oryzias javanicus]|uniref:Immunoglobulin subtype domain-containing protein n=1 Tax=Oryzias javanicus TaxID=123683 RepID=A0A3S2M6T8_ORYJA|nr:hypothetical protein OJAV_G00168170 [Oryzias javanicus]